MATPRLNPTVLTLQQIQRAIGVINSGQISITGDPPQPTVSYSYRVKIINPWKKSDVMVRELHRFSSKFESVAAIRQMLINEFESHVPNSDDFNVGYFEGQTKIWLVTSDDIKSMYCKYDKGGQITIWCDGKSSEINRETRKRKSDHDEGGVGRRQEKESEVDEVYKDLKTKHGDKFEIPKLRLWSRMICSDLHDDYENPPAIPAFSMGKKPRKDTVSEAITGAAKAVTHAFQCNNLPVRSLECHSNISQHMSPSKMVEVRLKNLEQLKVIQQLHEDNILTLDEYSEQKAIILSTLRKLT